jgi:short-subunit dehydrogenase
MSIVSVAPILYREDWLCKERAPEVLATHFVNVLRRAPTTILITGASSGLGAALARAYAGPNRSLALWGRDRLRLEETAAACRALDASVEILSVDISDLGRMAAELEALDNRMSLDLAILNAGLGGTVPPEMKAEDPERARDIALVDFASPVMAASILAGRMAERGSGHIALIGSIAESFPLPVAPAYSGAKAGLSMFAEALRVRMKRYGVQVSLIAPGFIDTPMSRSVDSPKPFLLDADGAARTIRARLSRGSTRFVLPWQFSIIRGAYRLLPRRISSSLLDRFS